MAFLRLSSFLKSLGLRFREALGIGVQLGFKVEGVGFFGVLG